MRVQPISGANTHKQKNPYTAHYAGVTTTGKPASGFSFEEYFKSYSQHTGVNKPSREPEENIENLRVELYTPLIVYIERELKHIDIAL